MKPTEMERLHCLVELHIHLDGALSVGNCRRLAELQGIQIPESDGELKELLTVMPDCRDLNQFLEKFAFPCSLLQTAEGISEAVCQLQEELLSQGILYAEIRFAPQLSTLHGLSQEEVVQAAIRGLNRSALRSSLILCCMRGSDTHEANAETIRLAAGYLNQGVCAVDLAGAEALFPTDGFQEEFALASSLHVPFTIHAGEADGPESVRKAIEYGAVRIGHGVRSHEDPDLLRLIAEKGILLEVCPTSNLCTCVFKSIAELPIREFENAGVLYSINTDDPVVCDTFLKKELNLFASAFNKNLSDVLNLQLTAINASFADDATKEFVRKAILEAMPA